ncbi:hypothetical protein A3I36_00220 [Candidatus Giovannonibacteria bacterium RIFCSPLOWO2_02_FULL_45_28]|uniref:Uncharacterized protein n=2 Tax=Candidatus Giovannoniibacteriota TaxID=1752738 RepID=A0A1F5WAS1_9BACT|nr:MAG: hypothetical protein UW15_C0019G0013 [Parcubacteria group bacterium GW2011_GWC1_44_10]KKT59266.1 MAG: hypothetical protein UW53_C0017G0013 [Candidatus Giovannonibacteria bacterium GW2011_GWA1_44_25]KKU29554.1 MAG: hypothetical protein UX43_C0009G0006 [Candidatus Giovannonibacteria bacterium GW2011_GWB1_46_20]OGF49232.1 MAG: hypothetical protein A2120_04120 [Candidatus Giovannonibacteria bacterium GWA2_45_15]OGF59530.1 MAG: hypothetical protein A2W40_02795 [Candidatus Giovannonibacteria 
MENENQIKNGSSVHIGVLVLSVAVASYIAYSAGQGAPKTGQTPQKESESASFEIPMNWGDLGVKMISVGVIDPEKFESIYAQRGGLSPEEKQILYGSDNKSIKMTEENAGFLLNMLWALGLGNKNDILESGPMSKYGDVGNFASTGGWILAKNDPMDHYSRHRLIMLTDDQQKLVERVSQNIYRPCCDNATNFPDCNHGMAMLGLLELLAANGASEQTMYKAALRINQFWFPDQYATIAKYLQSKGKSIESADPREILGRNYSSASGFRKIAALVPQTESRSSGGCGVDSGQPAAKPQQGCGI